jgi:phage terminase large subunit-like protein
MSREDKIQLLQLLEEKERRAKYRKLHSYYPDSGPLRRELYKKHLEFFEAGILHEERLFLAANRVGKTEGAGGYETAIHLSGLYPHWWTGKRFDKSIDAWAAGDTNETVRDIIQLKLLGPLHDIGSGLIPKESIKDYTRKRGVSDSVDTIYVKHASGGVSQIGLKSYDQKRISFQGTKKDLIWLDEEPPLDIYTEALLRTTDTTGKSKDNGLIILTFTPLLGMSEVVMSFLHSEKV